MFLNQIDLTVHITACIHCSRKYDHSSPVRSRERKPRLLETEKQSRHCSLRIQLFSDRWIDEVNSGVGPCDGHLADVGVEPERLPHGFGGVDDVILAAAPGVA